MEVANNYLPAEQHLVDKIVYELKAQGIFDQFRKECFADVDTKPAYQNLRQRVEGSVSGFLKDQSWRPDMNKNQVREMLRKTITESGFLETGVERIVDQVVNPKINTVFLPKVEEIIYSYLGIKKPNRNEPSMSDQCDLLPTDLEAISPESEPVDKGNDKSNDNFQDLDESKTEEDESPPFEPLEEQSVYVLHEENSVDSHVSGFSGLVSHESNHSNENKVAPMGIEQDSQMSRNSTDSRLSIVTSDENSKMDISEDSQSKLVRSGDSNHKYDNDKNKPKNKTLEKQKCRSESKSDKDRKNSKDLKSRDTSSSSSKDKDKSRDRKDSKSTSNNSNKNDKDKPKDKDCGKNVRSKHSSSKDKTIKKDSSRSDKDKSRSSSSHKDSKPRDKSSDSKSKEKSSSADKYKHSASHKKDKDKKKEKSKDDHYSSRDKRNDRRSTDRDSNDGQSSKQNFPSLAAENRNSQTQKSSQESTPSGGDSGNSDQTETTTKAPVIITVENTEVTISASEAQRVKVLKPKCASNIQEALRLRKIRKQLSRLEKQNQLSLTSVDLNSPILLSSSINLDALKEDDKKMQETLNSKIVAELEVVPSPLQNTVISQDNWDAMEAKLREEVYSEFKEFHDDTFDDSTEEKCQVIETKVGEITNENTEEGDGENCKYFDSVDIEQIEFLRFVPEHIKTIEQYREQRMGIARKRKLEDHDLKNNNNKQLKISPDKKVKLMKKNKEKNNYNSEISANEKFPLPLSPAESDKSKDDAAVIPLKIKRNSITKANNQRYSSDDLYKPRPTFASSRRRGAKNLEN